MVMRFSFIALVLLLLHSSFCAGATWYPISDNPAYTISSAGDPMNEGGVALEILSNKADATPEGAGAMIVLDPMEYMQHVIRISGELEQLKGSGSSIVWLRADGAEKPLGFINSENMPVRLSDGVVKRSVELYIPNGTKRVVLGVAVVGEGLIRAKHLKVEKIKKIEPDQKNQPTSFLEDAIKIIQKNAISAKASDIRADLKFLEVATKDARVSADVYPEIDMALKSLGDNHSFLMRPEQVLNIYSRDTKHFEADVSVRSGIGHVIIPSFSSKNETQTLEFVRSYRRAIALAASQVRHGWLIDLSTDSGGNMWPMLRALGFFLGKESVGSFVYRDEVIEDWKPSADRRSLGCPDLSFVDVPVAVIISGKTASAGEAVAIAFKGRPHTRFFGSQTFGQTSANREFRLSDGSALELAVAWNRDRNGIVYKKGLSPDVDMPLHDIGPAITWLKEQGS